MKIKKLIKPIRVLVISLLVIGFGGCSSVPTIPNTVYQFSNLESVKSVSNFRLDSWVKIDDRSLIVRSSPSKSYLMILAYPNIELNFNEGIIISSTAGSVNANFDTVAALGQSSANMPVPISAIYKLASRQQEKAVKEQIEAKKALIKPYLQLQ